MHLSPRTTPSRLARGMGVLLSLLISACMSQGEVGALPNEARVAPPTDRRLPDAAPVEPGPGEVDEAPVPTLESMSPSQTLVGSGSLELEIRGRGFVERTTLQVAGLAVPTQVVSSTVLRASLAPRWMAAPGDLLLSVGTAPPGGGASAEHALSVVYPVPVALSLSPMGVGVGAPDTGVTLTGSNFTEQTGVRAGDVELLVTERSSSSVTAKLPKSLLSTSGVLALRAWNPSPGGGATEPLSFVVSNPTVAITQLAPSTLRVGDGPTSLTVTGVGFVPSSTVLADGQALQTSFISSTSLKARFVATSLAANFSVVVSNPPPGGGLSAPVQLSVVNPVPSLSSMSASAVVSGSTDISLVLAGEGFVPGSRVTVGGEAVTVSYVNAQCLKVLVPSRMMSTGGFLTVQVQNPAPGGGASGALELVVSNPTPVITSASTYNIPRGTTRTTVALNTTGVVPGAVVYLGGAAMATRIGLNGLVSADLVWPNHEVVPLRIRNPAPAGGDSAPIEITVDCDSRGAELTFPTTNVVQSVPTNLSSQSRYASFDAMTAGLCSTVPGATVPVLGRGTTQPVRAVVMQNTSFAPVSLEAWADCEHPEGAAFLSLYPGRKSMPTSYDDRRMCSGVIAHGGAFSSPDSPEAAQCPGLTVANAGAVTVGVCETAVVVLQAINASVADSLPEQLRLRTRLLGNSSKAP